MKTLNTFLAVLLAFCSLTTDLRGDTFGTGGDQFTIDFVTIGDIGNPSDTTGNPNPAGSVNYVYRIGKFEISREMVVKANATGALGLALLPLDFVTGGPRPEMPATGLSWNEAARFVNWLNTSSGFPPAYKFSRQPGDADYRADANIGLWVAGDAGFDAANPFRNSQARYFLASVHEWYKAAYYDPNAAEGAGGYWDYPTGSDAEPTPVANGTAKGTAVYSQSTVIQGPADVTLAGGLSPYGVMALGGNVWEWEETEWDLVNDNGSSARGVRGGGWWLAPASALSSSGRNFVVGGQGLGPTIEYDFVGFRVASIPEPGNNTFTTPDRGGVTLATTGASTLTNTGYGWVRPETGSATPAGIAIFGYRAGGILVSETGVPAGAPLRSGRIYAEVNLPLNTGVAIANPNEQTATINFFFTDAAGNNVGADMTTIPPHQQIAKFLNETPFKTFSGTTFQGTFSFTSDQPVGVVALRGLLNERPDPDFLMSTLPVIDTSAPPTNGTVAVPHFSDGGGWTTEILLVNPTNTAMNGVMEFRNDAGALFNVTIGAQMSNTFSYSVQPRSSQKFKTSGTSLPTSGSIRILPTSGGPAPAPLAVFSYRPAGITLSEAGAAASSGTAFRMYVESSGTPGASGNIQSGIAIVNTAATPANVTLELTGLDGTTAGLPAPQPRLLPAFGHVGNFLAEFFPSLSSPFRGILRVSVTSGGIAVVGLRARYNERPGAPDFLMTTTPPANEAAPALFTERLFPHLADGGGYTTQFILFSGTAGQSSSGSLILVQPSGLPLAQTLIR